MKSGDGNNSRNLARFFTHNRQIAWVALVATLVWGVFGYMTGSASNGAKSADERCLNEILAVGGMISILPAPIPFVLATGGDCRTAAEWRRPSQLCPSAIATAPIP